MYAHNIENDSNGYFHIPALYDCIAMSSYTCSSVSVYFFKYNKLPTYKESMTVLPIKSQQT